MDELEATRRIRARDWARGRGRTPIVAVTAHADPATPVRCFKAGVDGLLAKPMRTDDLAEVLSATRRGGAYPGGARGAGSRTNPGGATEAPRGVA